MTAKQDDDSHAIDQENISLRGMNLSVVPSTVFSLEKVRRLDLSVNSLTRFPGARVAQVLPCLEVLVLSNNLLHVLEDILALASVPRLCELDLRDNPIRLNHNRLYLLETLLFHDTLVDENILRVLHLDESLKDFKSDLPSSRNMLYRLRLPRRRGFPMLQRLNGDWILDAETRQAEVERGKVIEYSRLLNRCGTRDKIYTRRKLANRGGIKLNERRFDGSRMTVKQILRNEARITAIPLPQVLTRYQIDMESCEEINATSDSESLSPSNTCSDEQERNGEQDSGGSSDEEDKERILWQQLLRPIASKPLDSCGQQKQVFADNKRGNSNNESELWSHPISTFDDLQSDERQYVRYKSKHMSGAFERDDHYFESTTFVDCVAQCERSRRLTIRAVDLLTQPYTGIHDMNSGLQSSQLGSGAQSTPALSISEASATLTHNLSANFTKAHARASFERLTDFQQKQVRVGDIRIQAEVGDYLLGEHVALRQKTNQLLSAHGESDTRWHENPHSIEANLEESLSKLKLRNAVDLANTLVGSKEQKRLIQALIDADAKVIEEERVQEEYKTHCQRLRRINARQMIQPQSLRDDVNTKKLASLYLESPWQARNWRAKTALLQRKQEDEAPPTQSPSAHAVLSSQPGKKKPPHHMDLSSKTNSISGTDEKLRNTTAAPRVADKFRHIETVEKAARDLLSEVNSHDLLVRCSEIRQNKDRHVRALALHRDRFLDEETEWEEMRQDPINVVRRHLRRKLYQGVQQIQIGSMEYFYSPLFRDAAVHTTHT